MSYFPNFTTYDPPRPGDPVLVALEDLAALKEIGRTTVDAAGDNDDDYDAAEMAAERAVFVAEPSSIAGIVGLLDFAAELVEVLDGVNDMAVDDVYAPALRRAARFLEQGIPADGEPHKEARA